MKPHFRQGLRFAANDARAAAVDLKETLSKTGVWESVTASQLISTREHPEEAAKDAVRTALASLATTIGPEDLLVLSFSGHGFTDAKGKFYLAPSDIRTETPQQQASTSISTDELTDWLRPIDAGDIVFLVDSCQSAASIESEGFKPGPMGSSGLGQLAYDKKMRVLAASQSDALEDDRLGHGFLTYALLVDGLEKNQADWRPHDGRITIGEWLAYGLSRVPQLLKRGTLEPRGVAARAASTTVTQIPALFDFDQRRKIDIVLSQRAAR
jgi:uncharacterized caspase-like protein